MCDALLFHGEGPPLVTLSTAPTGSDEYPPLLLWLGVAVTDHPESVAVFGEVNVPPLLLALLT